MNPKQNSSRSTSKIVNYTKPFDKRMAYVGLASVIAICILILILNKIGLTTTTYEAAKQYDNMARILVWLMGGITGTLFALRIARPRKIKQRTGLRTFLAVIGFIFGFIPGLILAMIISYPLSQHACRLSGSKYC
jgi:uncharacterized integral membrane protein